MVSIKRVTVKTNIREYVPSVIEPSFGIGRRHARNDEVGTPLAITIDFQTAQDNTVTLRERDCTKQIRQPIDTIIKFVKDLVSEATS